MRGPLMKANFHSRSDLRHCIRPDGRARHRRPRARQAGQRSAGHL